VQEPVRIGQGREAEILDWSDGRVLRLLWSADREPWLERESAALQAANAAGAPVPPRKHPAHLVGAARHRLGERIARRPDRGDRCGTGTAAAPTRSSVAPRYPISLLATIGALLFLP
jgi:hypothetical protein